MDIEPFRIEDYDQLLALWDRCGLPCDRSDRDSKRALERQIFDDHVAVYVLRREGRIIGSVIATSDGRKGWINRLAIDPEFRGRHWAAQLVEKAEQFLLECGLHVVAALIEDENTPSMAAFRHSGYEAWPQIVYFRKELP